MAFLSTLNLRNAVSVSRTTQTVDGMGGFTTTTSTVVIGRAAIWQAGSGDVYLSDKVAALSSHVMACRVTDDVRFSDQVTYNGNTYDVAGKPEDVQQRGKVQIVPLQLVE